MNPLRPYQQQAHDAIITAYRHGAKSTLVVMPTGSGKSRVIASVLAVAKRPTLVLAHTRQLIGQLAAGFRAQGLDVGVEMGDSRSHTDIRPVTVASVQSMGKRLTDYPADTFGLVVRDEAHRAPADSKILAHFSGARLLGVTATPDRTDGRPLGKVFETVAYEYPIGDAIRDGYLCPLRMRSIRVDDLTLANVAMKGKHDYDPDDLEKQLCVEGALHAVADPLLRLAGDRPTIIFCASVKHARMLVEVMDRYRKGSAISVCGEDKDADDRIERFRRGEVQFLANVAMLTEGTDIPPIACVAMARPTQSRSLMVQCLDEKTRVLSRRGWIGIDEEITVSDEFASYDIKTGAIEWSPALSVVCRPLADGERMFGISSQSTDIRVTEGHRMVVRNRKQANFSIVEAGSVGTVMGEPWLPVSGVQAVEAAPLTDDEIRFIGWVVTDGHVPKTGTVAISQAQHQPQIKDLEQCLVANGFRYAVRVQTGGSQWTRTSPMNIYRISKGDARIPNGTGTKGWWRLAEFVRRDWHAGYEKLDRRQLGVLLEAMHLGNGNKQLGQNWTRRSYHISMGKRIDFCRSLQSLCIRRGYRASVVEHGGNCIIRIKDITEQTLPVRSSDSRPCFVEVPSVPGERVWCIETKHGTLVTERNGKPAILGNCIGRGLRLHPGKTDCLALDFTGADDAPNLRSPADALGGSADQAVTRQLRKKASDVDVELQAALAEAEQFVAEEVRRDLIAKAQFTEIDVDALNPFQILRVSTPAGRYAGQPAGPALIEAAREAGLRAKDVAKLDRGQVETLLEAVAARRRKGLCSIKTARWLIRFGLNPDVDAQAGRDAMTAFASTEWRFCPPSIRTDGRFKVAA